MPEECRYATWEVDDALGRMSGTALGVAADLRDIAAVQQAVVVHTQSAIV